MQQPNWRRSIFHAATGVTAIAIYWGELVPELLSATGKAYFYAHEREVAGKIVFGVFLLFVLLEMLRPLAGRMRFLSWVEVFFMGMSKPKEESGAISSMPYYALGVLLLFVLLDKRLACAGVACLAFGDPAGCWGGYFSKRLDIRGLRYSPDSYNRSVGGCLAMFLVCLGSGTYFLGLGMESVLVSVFATVLEFLCGYKPYEDFEFIEDNLLIPVGVIAAEMLIELVS